MQSHFARQIVESMKEELTSVENFLHNREKLQQQFCEAIKQRDNTLVEYFLTEVGSSIFIRYRDKETYYSPLHIAVQYSSLSIIKLLVRNGFDINTKVRGPLNLFSDQWTSDNCLMVALAHSRPLPIIVYILNRGIDINHQNHDRKNAYLISVEQISQKLRKNPKKLKQSLLLLKELEKRGVDINAVDSLGRNVFLIAARSGNVDLLKYLADLKVDVHHKDCFGNNAFIHMFDSLQVGRSYYGSLEASKFLISLGVDIYSGILSEENRFTKSHNEFEFIYNKMEGVLHSIVRCYTQYTIHMEEEDQEIIRRFKETFSYFLKLGYPINTIDPNSRRIPLQCISTHTRPLCFEILKYLVKNGGDLLYSNYRGTILQHIFPKIDWNEHSLQSPNVPPIAKYLIIHSLHYNPHAVTPIDICNLSISNWKREFHSRLFHPSPILEWKN